MNGSDQDSDSCYTTNQIDIVRHAKYCYENYSTIVNLVPKQKNIYDLSMESYAEIDNKLAAAQLAIGQSSNLAQLCLTYTYNYDDNKYIDYVCILSVIAQISIDNAKRSFDIDINEEIDRINSDMNVEENGLPLFWQITKKDKRKARSDEERMRRQKENKEKIKAKINKDLVCPMNYLYGLDFDKFRNKNSTLPMSAFFIKHEPDQHHRKCRKVEELIERYSLELYSVNINNDKNPEEYLLLKDNFNNMIDDIRSTYISKNYAGLMSWLINRAFSIGSGVKRNENNTESIIKKNRALLMKTLYMVNKDAFLSCFTQNVDEKVAS